MKKGHAAEYEKFVHNHNRLEINTNLGLPIPLIVLNQPIYDKGQVTHKGILYCGDSIIDDLVALHPNIKDSWFLVSTTQSHIIPISSKHPDLNLYATQTGEPAAEYHESQVAHIPDLVLGCGHFVDPELFYPDPEIEKQFDLIYVTKWAPTKRVELIIEAAKLAPHLKFAIVGFPVLSERKREASEQYRKHILQLILEAELDNVDVFEDTGKDDHKNSDGTFVPGGFSKNEIRQFLNRSRSSILAADSHEGVNRSVGEALSTDVPVILTKDSLGGVQTMISEETGLMIDPDAQAIVDGVEHIIAQGDDFSPREWYTTHYGKTVSNARLRAKIAEIVLENDLQVNMENIREYGGDPWSKDYYDSLARIT
jgi:glycosyltransferase involved in cell wall biosynthesis